MRYLLVLIVGLFLGIVATKNQQINSLFSTTQKTAEPEVLYWVAPMDANYQRDKPGKSPMGMDLVPVYAEAEKAEPKILYWVAPMDANYQRDKPGKSPMGMDLVPVYEEAGGESEAGLVKISPAVENNLGVRTGKVVNAPLNISINTLGTVQANENGLWQINSRVSGWIEKLYVKSVGVEVKKGQPLFDLYSPELVKAQESLFNAMNLNRNNLITSSKARLQALGVNKDQIENIIKNKKVLQNITVFAPQKGTISKLKLNEGAFISPSTVVITAVNLDTVWVDVEVFAAQVSLVKLGDLASMTLDYFPGQKWEGQVDFIYPEMNASNRTLRVRLQFDNPTALLKLNMFASVTLIPQMKQRTLQIPREAVIYAGNMNRVVLALGEGNFKSVLVNLGLENKQSVEVLSGLSEGQEIVTSAQFLLDSESSISADFGRMLELDKNKKSQPESDSSNEDDDLDWLDLGEQSDFGLSGNNTSGPVARKVTL
ncbi:efflux RND transporter periplasmic adaptor subunit [Psychromonas sp. MB-3u-54]|uniref:efflux RND transporter periplasmic adaptor subunit n=1 Tax=Psychromonas sp. MB-3u-54 TaxID=2058319 RepID=UPI000C3276E6|nr:efflux RND transporter periplasmic adaptor subunit [Psychromonas sp. MB-3u-54]PKH02098.1 efflux RND transporter periplasmic adaptor subunit [Psychromonas sp. MB-3u-54]